MKALKNGEPVSRSSPIFRLSQFLGQDGLLRIQGRLQFAGLPTEAQHLIIVPKGHLGLLLARHAHATMKHAGVNSMLVKRPVLNCGCTAHLQSGEKGMHILSAFRCS